MESNHNNGMKNIVSQLILAGAAALGSTAAHAQIVYTDLSASNVNVGFATGDTNYYTIGLPGASIFFEIPGAQFNGVVVAGVNVRTTQGTLAAFGSVGQTAYQFGGGSGSNDIIVAGDFPWGPLTSVSEPYIAFTFSDSNNGGQKEFGWIEVSEPDSSFNGLTVNIIGYAYDQSGNRIAMGDTGPTSVPEPSAELALAALSALALGAAGIKRMKALQN